MYQKVKKRTIITIKELLVIVSIIGFIASCAVGIPSTDKPDVPDGYGTLEVKIPSTRGWEVDTYTITATKPDEDPVIEQVQDDTVTLTLVLGTWDIQVDGEDDTGNIIYNGAATADVTESGTSVTIGLLKRSGNLNITVVNLPGYDIESGDPGYIERITVTASKLGFPDVTREVNNFESSIYLTNLVQGNWVISISGDAKDVDPTDYSPLATYSTFVSGQYTEAVVASTLLSVTRTLTTQNRVTPVWFSHTSGSYSSSIDVELGCNTSGAAVLYSIDGSNPSVSYSGPVTIGAAQNITIRASASKDGVALDSIIGERTYIINAGTTTTPQITPLSGTYNSDVSVNITSPDGGTIYYTTDGSVPTLSSATYSGTLSVSGDGTTMTIGAIAQSGTMDPSSVASETYIIEYPQTGAPAVSPATGSYMIDQAFTFNCGTPNSTIYYTTDGTTPTTASILYSTPITLPVGSYTIKVFAVAPEYSDSVVVTETYTISDSVENSISFTQADIIVIDEEWGMYDLEIGINWFGIENLTAGTYIIEWQSGFEGIIEVFENDMVTSVPLSGTVPVRNMSIDAARYFVRINSTYAVADFDLRIFFSSASTTTTTIAVTTTTIPVATTTTTTVPVTTTTTTTVGSSGDLLVKFQNCSSQNVWIPGDHNSWTITDPDIALVIDVEKTFSGVVTSTNIAKGTSTTDFEIAVCYDESWGKWTFSGWTFNNCSLGADGNIEVPSVSDGDNLTIVIDDSNDSVTATIE